MITHTHTHPHNHKNTHKHTTTKTHNHTHTHTHTNTHTHTCTHTHARAHTHTHSDLPREIVKDRTDTGVRTRRRAGEPRGRENKDQISSSRTETMRDSTEA